MFDPFAIGLFGGFGKPDRHHLRGVIPFVDGRRDVEPFIALQPDEPPPQRLRSKPWRSRSCSTPASLFEEQRTRHAQRKKQHRRQCPVAEIIAARREHGHGLVDRGRRFL